MTDLYKEFTHIIPATVYENAEENTVTKRCLWVDYHRVFALTKFSHIVEHVDDNYCKITVNVDIREYRRWLRKNVMWAGPTNFA